MAGDLLTMAMPAFAVLALAVVGWAVLVLLPAEHRSVIAPGAPALGLLTAVVVLHACTLVVGMDVGAWLLAGAAITTLVVVGVRRPGRLVLPRATLARLAVGIGLGVVPLVVGLQPSFRVDDANVMHPNQNHDAYWYVSLASWLEQHPGVEEPEIAAQPTPAGDSPAYAPARSAINGNFRLGESLVHAAMSAVVDRPVSADWYELNAVWLVLLPGAAIVLAEVLRSRWWWGALAGTTASLASLAGFQVYNQNSASLSALASLPLTIALVRLAAEHREGRDGWVTLLLAGIGLGGFVGSYSELASVVGLPLLLTATLGLSGGLAATLRRAVAIPIAGIVVCPLAFANAVRLWATLSSFVSAWERRAFTSGWSLAVARAVGTSGIDEQSGTNLLTVVLLVVLVTGLVTAIATPRLRALSIGLPVSTAMFLVAQVRRHDNYSIERLLMVSQPLLVLVSVLGLGALADAVLRRRVAWAVEPAEPDGVGLVGRRWVAAAVGAVTGLSLFVGSVEARTTVRNLWPTSVLEGRSIGPEVTQAIGWVRHLSDVGHGRSVAVVTDDYVDRLWLADGLRSYPEVSYPFLLPDYFSTTAFTSDSLPRFVLISREALTNAPRSAVVRENDRYVLVDTAGIDAWFAMDIGGFSPAEPMPEGRARLWMGDGGSLVVMRTSADVLVSLAIERLEPVGDQTVHVFGADAFEVGTIAVDASSIVATLPLPAVGVTQVWLQSDQPAQVASDLDRRLLTVSLIGPSASAL